MEFDFLNIIRQNGFSPPQFSNIESCFIRPSNVFTDGELIFKFALTPQRIRNSEKQFSVLSALKNKTSLFTIPTVEFFSKTETYSLLVYKKIEGEIIDWSQYAHYTNQNKILFSESLGEILSELHQLLNSNSELIELFIGDYAFETKTSFCEYLINKINTSNLPIDEKNYCNYSIRAHAELLKKVDEDQNRILIHNDINIQNLVLRKSKVIGLFDFDNAEFSQPYSEFRFIYLHDIVSAEIVLKRYSKMSECSFDEPKLFLLGLIAGLSGIAHLKNANEAYSTFKTYIKDHGHIK